ncbi:hypothetical protein BC629DRAFT_1513976 [Irpex lacteus]|nr:hypothetical protein BC629DRAFT_1513976 [Irpex lacteus]
MHPATDLLAGRGQPQTTGRTSVLAPRGILVRRDSPFRSPRAVESRVRLNMRAYVAEALEGGDWRNRANYVQDEHWDMASAVAILQRREDRPVLYPRRNDAVELIQLCENTSANVRLLAQPADRGVTVSALAEAEFRDLEVVDCGDDYSPVRGDLPESLAVTEEWLRLRGRGKLARTSIYDTDTGEQPP